MDLLKKQKLDYLRDNYVYNMTEDFLCLMEDKGLTRKDVSTLAGMQPQAVNRFFRGENVGLLTTCRIAHALGVKIRLQIEDLPF